MENKKEKVLVNFRIPVALKERLEMMADKQDQTLTAFVQKTFRFVAFMDPPFWPAIEHLADIYGLSESHIIQGIVARYLAESEAYKEIHGDAPRMMTEFSRMQSGAPLPMEELIKRLKHEFIRDARVEELLKEPSKE